MVIDPYSLSAGSVTLALYDVPADISGAIVPGGDPVVTATQTPGQNGALTFSGTAGQRVLLLGTNGMAGQIALTCDVNVTIRNPNGTVLAPATCMEGSGFIDVTTLPTTGTYTIAVDPTAQAVGNLTLKLYDVPTDTTGNVTIGAPAVSAPLATGQVARLTFSATSGQQVTVRLTSNTFGLVTVRLLKPDGSQLTITSSTASSFNLAGQTLSVTGTYTIVIDPNGANSGSINVAVTTP
jgi:hypothetical protein